MDFDQIALRIKEQFCPKDAQQTAPSALARMADDGSFSDIDYTCNSPAGWPLLGHLARICALSGCYAYQKDSEYYHLGSIRDAILRGLTFWFRHDFHNPNWWYNELGVPQQMRMIALYMSGDLPQPLLDRLLGRLQDDIEEKWTGTNRMWFAENMLVKAAILQNEPLLQKARGYLLETMTVASTPGTEGMQVDGSFAQHGMQLYNNGYGFSFLSCITKWMYILDTDGARLEPGAIRAVTDLVLKGNRFMCRFSEIDPQTRSREIVRGYAPSPEQQMESRLAPIQRLIAVNREETVKQQLQQFADFIKKKRTNPGVTANTMYYRLDFMTHSMDSFYASTRLLSAHTLGGDVCGGHIVNGENALAGLMAYGMTLFMIDGSEYHNIYPLWDWGRLPGVTSPDIALRLEEGALCAESFAGGASAGILGVCALAFEKEYSHNGQAASFGGRKAVFYFGDEIYLMGDRLHTTAPEDFQTTVDQCWFRGEAFIDGQRLTNEASVQTIGEKIYHNGICYALREPAEIAVRAELKSGLWSTISISAPIPAEQNGAQGEVFTAYLPHTVGQDARYEYAVLPGVTQEYAALYSVKEQFITTQTDIGFAVYHTAQKALMAVFFSPGSIQIGRHNVSCTSTGFVIVQRGHISFTAPEVEGDAVNVTYDGKASCFHPGSGVYRGRTETEAL